MVAGWNPLLFPKHRFHILHIPNSTGLFTRPTGHRYTKYQFSPYIKTSNKKMGINELVEFGKQQIEAQRYLENELPVVFRGICRIYTHFAVMEKIPQDVYT